jgi:hypothetical protein
MAVGDFCDFLNRLGHDVIDVAGATWYDVQPRVFMSVPYHRLVAVDETAIQDFMRERRVRALRFPVAPSEFGFDSLLAINCKRDYDLASQHHKARSQTRRGIENCVVERADFAFLSREGLRLNRDTARRQGIENQYVDQRYWSRFCAAAGSCAGMSAWCAFVDGRVAAFLVAAEIDGWVEWIVNHSSSHLRNAYPNNALVYIAARHFLVEKHCAGICYGLGSIEPTPALDHYKARMGWDLVPIRQRLVFSAALRTASRFVPPATIAPLRRLVSARYGARKALAMLEKYKAQRPGRLATALSNEQITAPTREPQ